MIILIVIFHISYVKATSCLVAFLCNVTGHVAGHVAIFHVCISGCVAPLAPPAPLA